MALSRKSFSCLKRRLLADFAALQEEVQGGKRHDFCAVTVLERLDRLIERLERLEEAVVW